MSETPAYIRRPAPALGEHNEFVLGELLGRSPAQIEKLYEMHVIGKEPVNPPTFRPLTYEKQLADGTLAEVDPDYRKVLGIE